MEAEAPGQTHGANEGPAPCVERYHTRPPGAVDPGAASVLFDRGEAGPAPEGMKRTTRCAPCPGPPSSVQTTNGPRSRVRVFAAETGYSVTDSIAR